MSVEFIEVFKKDIYTEDVHVSFQFGGVKNTFTVALSLTLQPTEMLEYRWGVAHGLTYIWPLKCKYGPLGHTTAFLPVLRKDCCCNAKLHYRLIFAIWAFLSPFLVFFNSAMIRH